MISSSLPLSWTVRLLAPLVWRTPARSARKLLGFSATEAGSALDMLRAAELETDPRLRRLFFQHAVDESRHAALFRAAADTIEDALEDAASVVAPAYSSVHATRQNLYENLGRTRFLAFVNLAEREGQCHFAELARHFKPHPELGPLFAEIEKDERFHVAYSATTLDRLRADGNRREVRRAVVGVRWTRAREAWRRAGRQLGDLVTRVGLAALFFTVLPVFALAHAWFEPERTGWIPVPDPLDRDRHARRHSRSVPSVAPTVAPTVAPNAAPNVAHEERAALLIRLRRSF